MKRLWSFIGYPMAPAQNSMANTANGINGGRMSLLRGKSVIAAVSRLAAGAFGGDLLDAIWAQQPAPVDKGQHHDQQQGDARAQP